MIDTVRRVSTPEGVELELRCAGILVRSGALFLDWLILGFSAVFIAAIFAVFGRAGMGLFFVLLFFAWWFYPIFFEVLSHGSTPGKKAMGIKVVHNDGTPVGWGASFLRNLLLAADLSPLAPLAGVVTMFLNRDFARLGDLAAGTRVIYRDDSAQVPKFKPAEPSMPQVALHQHEQRAIIEFAERHNRLAPRRQEELANLLEPLTGERGKAGVAKIVGIATHLVEER